MLYLNVGLFFIFLVIGFILALSQSAKGSRIIEVLLALALGGGGGIAVCKGVTVNNIESVGILLTLIALGTLLGILGGIGLKVWVAMKYPGAPTVGINIMWPLHIRPEYEIKENKK